MNEGQISGWMDSWMDDKQINQSLNCRIWEMSPWEFAV